ncbi:MAG: 16S rRNA (cytosine(1402)-N(4))-methyltransferase RsmH [Oscillospiraceae bacterium]|jgi:16S rRNA (cytosine1402-N4)-methyltransferase|nr:16S rRNA (cytosine(1402)-N(4))-methyltransferase RsmH [Oscillospiraceae bacterium]
MDQPFTHESVLLDETVQALNPRADGIYMDGTGGGGGHTARLRELLGKTGRIVVFDRDPDAITALRARFADDHMTTVVHANFFEAAHVLHGMGIPALDGVMLDLGVSSPQLDRPERGFSYHADGFLDMRMDQSGKTAADVIHSLSAEALRDIFRDYGQEPYAAPMARAILRARAHGAIQTTTQLAEILANAVPAAARRGGHPAKRAFMALRYYCNGEIDGLSDALLSLFDSLNPNGRMAVISFNSLEDGIVKRTFAPLLVGCTCPKDFPVCVCGKKPRARTAQKPRTPSDAEIQRNPRSRSAKLRVIEKIPRIIENE